MRNIETFPTEDSASCQRFAIHSVDKTCSTRRAMNRKADIFESHRPRLFRIARRMLGSCTEAEDVLQDTYLHWYQSETGNVESTIAFLVRITTRLCLDRLRQLKQQRKHCVELPDCEAMVEDQCPSPESQLELTDEVGVAFLAVLERLGAEERGAFLLHDVFDYEYPEVAQMMGKAESTCRQMIHRARARVRESRRRFSVTAESRERVLRTFLKAARTGDRTAVMALVAEGVEYLRNGQRDT
jgi:RNA polymerase sigma-70 factor, ECF subfamily